MKGFVTVYIQLDESTYHRLKKEAYLHQPRAIPLSSYCAKLLGSETTWAHRKELKRQEQAERTIEDLASQVKKLLKKSPKHTCTVREACKKLRAYSKDIESAVAIEGSGLLMRRDMMQVQGKKRFWLALEREVEEDIIKATTDESLRTANCDVRTAGVVVPTAEGKTAGAGARPGASASAPRPPTDEELEALKNQPSPNDGADFVPFVLEPAAAAEEPVPEGEACPWCQKRRLPDQKTCGAKWCGAYQAEQDENLRMLDGQPLDGQPKP